MVSSIEQTRTSEKEKLNINSINDFNDITLFAVGDIMLGDGPTSLGFGVGSTVRKQGSCYIFSNVIDILNKGDIVFGNLEAILSTVDKRRQILRGDSDSIKGIVDTGFNIISLANNHILQYGKQGLYDTMSLLSANNIEYVGVGKNTEEARLPKIIVKNEISIAFLSYCLVKDPTAFLSINEPKDICFDVRRVKNHVDIVIVSLHWGDEFVQSPSYEQKNLAHKIVDAGADVILGHHPHVLQGIEQYKNALIAYSLGNFVFDMNYIPETRISIILKCMVRKSGVFDYYFHPIYINDNFQPELLEGERAKHVTNSIKELSNYLKQSSKFSSMEYKRQVNLNTKLNKRRMKIYFLKNILKYPISFSIKIILQFIRNIC